MPRRRSFAGREKDLNAFAPRLSYGADRPAVRRFCRRGQNNEQQNIDNIMLKLSDAKSQRPLTPAGTHLAFCYSVVDLGTHTEEGQYGKKTNRKIRVSWELPEERAVFDPSKGEQPYSISKTYNFTMGEKSTLRRDLEAWRGKSFTPKEMDEFELRKIVGTSCMVTVKHADKGGTTYDNVDSVTSVPRSLKDAALNMDTHNATLYYEVSLGEGEPFNRLPDWMKDMIRASKEWHGGEASSTGGGDAAPEQPEDDIPF